MMVDIPEQRGPIRMSRDDDYYDGLPQGEGTRVNQNIDGMLKRLSKNDKHLDNAEKRLEMLDKQMERISDWMSPEQGNDKKNK